MDLLCKWCGELKPEDQFVRRSSLKPYSQSNVRNCRECNSEYQRSRYKGNMLVRAKQLRANAAWRKANPDRMRLHEKKYFDANPEKFKARNRVGYLVRTGVWKTQPCVICGSQKQVEAHHNSYAEAHWETVIWLCKDHHESWHQVIDPIKDEVLAVPLADVQKLKNEALEIQKQIQSLRNEFRAKIAQASALELAAWNRVVERVTPLFEDFAKGTSPRTSSGGGLEEHTTRMSPA